MRRSVIAAIISLFVRSSTYAATHYVDTGNLAPLSPYTSWATASTNIQAAIEVSAIDDEVVVADGLYSTGVTMISNMLHRIAITNHVTVRSVNGPQVTIIEGTGPLGDTAVRCAYLADGALLAGFTLTNGHTKTTGDSSWEMSGGGALCGTNCLAVVSNCVLVGNQAANDGGGVSCGTLYSCILIGNQAGDKGGGAERAALHNCTLTGNRAGFDGGGASEGVLDDCTLSGNSAGDDGGGVHKATVYNCILTGNYAGSFGGGAHKSILYDSNISSNTAGDFGGGAEAGTLYGCLLVGNSARTGGAVTRSTLESCTIVSNSAARGGGAGYYGTLNNCTIVGNSATASGGVDGGYDVDNCIIYYNEAPDSPNWGTYPGRTLVLRYCCTTPDPASEGCITNDPGLADWANGNYHLLSNSPCINAGSNHYATTATDMDGLPRKVGTAVDMGAYEYPFTESGVHAAWLQQHGLPTDGTADLLDPDGDCMRTRDEYYADTIPTNSESVLRLLSIRDQTGGVRLDWKGGRDAWQFLEIREDMGSTGERWTAIYGIPPPTPATNAVIEMGATGSVLFYRIRAER